MKKAVIGLTAAAALAAMAAAGGKARIRKGKFVGDIYVCGKKSDSKMVFVTNQTPGKLVKNSIFGGK